MNIHINVCLIGHDALTETVMYMSDLTENADVDPFDYDGGFRSASVASVSPRALSNAR